MRPHDHFCDAVMGEKAVHAHDDTLFHRILREEHADLPAARRQRQAHGGKVALPALHDDMIHTAPRIVIDAPRGFGFNDGQVVVEDRDRDNGHAVRDEHDRRAEPPGRQVQRDAVGVAVAGHHGEIEMPARKELAVPPVVREQLHDAQRPEHAVAAHQGSRQPDRAPAVCDRGAREPRERRGHRGEPPFEAQLGPLAAGQHPAEIRDRAALVRPPGGDHGAPVAAGADPEVAPQAVQQDDGDAEERAVGSRKGPRQHAQAGVLGHDEIDDPRDDLAAVARDLGLHARIERSRP